MAEKQFRVMLRGIPPQELHGVKIALLVIDHTGELRHRLIVGADSSSTNIPSIP